MKILLVAATPFEIEPLLKSMHATLPPKPGLLGSFSHGPHQLDILITGVGMVSTAFFLGFLQGSVYNLALNTGVCGAFSKQLNNGDLVNVIDDYFSELGAEDGDEFLGLDQINLGNPEVLNEMLFSHKFSDRIVKVKGITVNTVHGNTDCIARIKTRLSPDVESMEGAAFLMAANTFKWPALQIRCVSNRVERRNRDNWDLPLAIGNLNTFIIEFLEHLS
ncbi:MAG: futalosine hydrolase [Bacteroidia bacterium]